MKRFVFTNKGSNEVIGVSDTQKSLQKAIEFFAQIKDLPVDEFIKLYEVKEVKKEK
jgi:ribosomal protein S2